MIEEEILEAIETILYRPSLYEEENRKRFYGLKSDGEKFFYTFSNETVELLLALSLKLVDERKKHFFWQIINPLAPRAVLLKSIDRKLVNLVNKVRRDIIRYQDFIFMFFVKSRKVDEALDIVGNKVTISSYKNNLLHVMLDILENEQGIFNKTQLDRILSITKSLKSFVPRAEDYQQAKLKHEKFEGSLDIRARRAYLLAIQNHSFQTDWTYEIDAQQIPVCKDLIKRIEAQVFVIRKNRLASVLFEGINLEINQDKNQLKDIIKEFSFNPILNETINKIDQDLQQAEDKFDFKTCIGLIRTFLNELCVSIALEIEKKTNFSASLPIEEGKKMGRAMNYFRDRRIDFLSEEEKVLLSSINSFMSYRGVHVLKSGKEYARISRNMAIEMGLFLMERLQKYIADLE